MREVLLPTLPVSPFVSTTTERSDRRGMADNRRPKLSCFCANIDQNVASGLLVAGSEEVAVTEAQPSACLQRTASSSVAVVCQWVVSV